MPVMLFEDCDRWFQKQFDKPAEVAMREIPLDQLAKCLESVLIGTPKQRKIYHSMLAMLETPQLREMWARVWHEQNRTSGNDIGARAKELAAEMVEAATAR